MSRGWLKKLQSRIDRYDFEIGVLEDKDHKNPVHTMLHQQPQLGSYAGGPVQRTSKESSGVSIGDVLIQNQERLNTDLLKEPFQKRDSEIIRFTNYFLRFVCDVKGTSIRRVENLLQAIVRNPILNEDYGQNTAATADNKGFDRHLFGTGQMFKAIKARARRK